MYGLWVSHSKEEFVLLVQPIYGIYFRFCGTMVTGQ